MAGESSAAYNLPVIETLTVLGGQLTTVDSCLYGGDASLMQCSARDVIVAFRLPVMQGSSRRRSTSRASAACISFDTNGDNDGNCTDS